MSPYGPAMSQLIEQFEMLPGVGRKSAERLAHFILMCPPEKALGLAEAIRTVKTTVRPCSICFNLTEGEACSICADSRRDHQVVCVVEQPRDLISIESSGAFQGVYHVLQGRISPLEGMGPEQLTIDALLKRIRKDGVREVVMATNPTLEGDGTALFISNLLADRPVKITRLARGIPSGSVLEFANREMLADALRGRQTF
ncbi:MAG TPA: recombination mediator RecR [Planctomycetaceae bacterium]|nr:recombination mediator RecR [Planctomycetaceae bacterium]